MGRLPGRRVGYALVAWGIAGLVLSLATIVLVAGPAARLQDLTGQRLDAVRLLDLADRSLVDAGASTSGAATSLASAETSARSASSLFRELASAMGGLRDASGLSIFGSQPFAGVGGELGRVADQSSSLADDIGTLAGTLRTETESMTRLAADIASLRAQLAGLREAMGPDALAGLQDLVRGLVGLGILIALWLALPALASVIVGVELLRRPRLAGPPAAQSPEAA